MLENHYTKEQIENVRKSLLEDGWCRSSKLPENWLYKKSGVRKELLFISPEGYLFKTASKLLKGAFDSSFFILRKFNIQMGKLK